jgi:diaminohydroxyphosphoribosylaminopyrimidine deaminase/5-amino-6-(5-phosphoribosylamino)uracil reductase
MKVENSEADKHIQYMSRALQLAALGRGKVSPNPMVGCVIVKDDHIIGEGFHQQYGGPHAEVLAFEHVKEGIDPAGCDVYVSLEPCAHFGKTPPCVNLIIEKKAARVFISTLDPNPLVAGKGVEQLIANGIEVQIGILEEEGERLNRRFFTFHRHKRPYIILKWAETQDGFIARSDGTSKWISNESARTLAHKWRSEEDVILVGTQTALLDNPQLNVRLWTGRNPIRAYIDKQMLVLPQAHLRDGSQITLCYTEAHVSGIEDLVEFVRLPQGESLPEFIIADLYQRQVLSLLIEGGSFLLQSFIDKGLWDEARIITAPKLFENGVKSPALRHGHLARRETISDNELSIYVHPQPSL